METTIRNRETTFTLYGLSKHHDERKPYRETIFELLDQVWLEVRSKGLLHTGINHVVYDDNRVIFAGIALTVPSAEASRLEKKEVVFQKFAYCKHIGPYRNLDRTHKSIRSAVKASGERHGAPVMEIYGHWHEDESRLETEILYHLM
ncbi:GyrI-like domain-containing protein [Paenibacillus humicola]|uniref:GyrI-like domain-containing protein n=1 Tax=Paenibacillus humicola TaxID=3110540 RepID=UPI00237A8311|nr:GyrI-like domain-containing protein [Paenibacillus humicola]